MTKEEKREYNKQYREKNKEKIKELKKQYREKNKEKIKEYEKEYNKKYRKIDKEKKKQYNKEYNKQYREKNKEKIKEYNKQYNKEYNKQYREKNKEKIKEQRKKYDKQYNKQYRKIHKEERKKYLKNKYHNDINYKITTLLRTRIRKALKRDTKSKGTLELLGCSVDELKQQFENQFTEGMTWDKFFAGEIHIDHIRPCSSFNLLLEEEQKKCFHYTNLQPLWAEDNLKKSNKYILES